ncbi:NAD(P)/FAD-dependent oxidoreductase [Methylobacter sp. S3L5C]|uniref:protoporphyrinogen/coproporphyrinogen oxidase n=1 Tax=Methylobacter sp. S3L5C TaxID=2839024 RepID=UPI001FAD56E4|nr:NAD(P)-binding protein [Methylobacter sp. S3L5C]UOA09527.1 NAD(P)-binding protein [Methylobacter sp. S3L5C]
MKKYKFVVLGAGPSGLTLAHALLDAGYTLDDILVIEQQSLAGGLCRSEIVNGAPLDIGGGHFLDVKRKEVLDFLFRFMPREEWNLHDRVSKIRIRGMEVDHPLEANLWQFPSEVQADYLESIAQAGCVRGEAMPESFAAWIKWKLGDLIAQEYMLPYNRKIWSMDPDELGTYWLYKLPNVSFRETLLSCLEGRPMGALPAHGTFLYPKEFGYGEVWRRMGEALGDSLITNCTVENIDLVKRAVNGSWQADTIISTIPWTLWSGYCALPKDILTAITSLKNAPIDVDYYSETLDSKSHWTYEPDESIAHHRLLLRSNFSPGAKGYWTEANATRSLPTDGVRFHNEFAYPINTLGKPEKVERILAWARENGIIGLGRWGRWEHMNSDIAVAESLQMASELTN